MPRKIRIYGVVLLAICLIAAGLEAYRLWSIQRQPIVELFVYAQSNAWPGKPLLCRVYAHDADRGVPLQGAKIELSLVRRDRGTALPLGTVETDAEGIGRLDVALDASLATGNYALYAVSHARGVETTVQNNLRVSRDTRTLLHTDKPLYQPGQVIHMRSLSLSAVDARPVASVPVDYEVRDPKGTVVFRRDARTSTFGIAAADFALADQVNPGKYELTVRTAGSMGSTTVEVRSYALPKLKGELENVRGFTSPGASVAGTLRATYVFGEPVTKAKVRIRATDLAYETPRDIATIEGTTDAEGRLPFTVSVPSDAGLADQDSVIRLEAWIAAPAGGEVESVRDVTLTKTPLRIHVIPERSSFVSGVENILYVVTTYPGGQPAKTRLTVEPLGRSVDTSDQGVARLVLGPNEITSDLRIIAHDDDDRRVETALESRIDDAPGALLLRPVSYRGVAGEPLKVAVFSSAPTGRVLVDVALDGRIVATSALQLQNGVGALSMELPSDVDGLIDVTAYRTGSLARFTSDTRLLWWSGKDALKVTIAPEGSSFRPGQEALLRFQVQDAKGAPVLAALGVSGVDEAVFAVRGAPPPMSTHEPGRELARLRSAESALLGIDDVSVLSKEGGADVKLEDARAALLSTASAHATEESASPRAKGIRSSRAYEAKNGWRQLRGLALMSPLLLLLAFVIMSLVHAFSRLRRSEPIRGRSDAEMEELRKATGSLLRRWALAIYAPGIAFIVLLMMDESRRYRLSYDWRGVPPLAGWVLAAIPALILLVRVERRLRAASAADDAPHLRLFARMAPFVYGATVFGAAAGFYATAIARPRWVDDDIAGFTFLILAFVIHIPLGTLGIARQTALREFTLRGRIWLGLSRLASGLLPLLAFAVAVLATLGYSAVASKSDEGAMAVDFDNKEGGTGTRAKGANAPAPSPSPAETTRSLVEPARVRRYFPETLLWRPELLTDERGQAELRVPLADSITTWRISASAVSAAGELGEATAPLRVTQDFFVDAEFPFALTQNDEIEVPVSVFNYMARAQEIELEVVAAPWFAIKGAAKRRMTIGAQKNTTVSFRILAKAPGTQKLTIKAKGEVLADAVEREVVVRPDGYPVTTAHNGTIGKEAQVVVNVPDVAMKGATDAYVKVYGGVGSELRDSLAGMVRKPHGCFEQSASSTYPSVFALAYLKRQGAKDSGLEAWAKEYVSIGYQRMLSFEIDGGGFDWYGHAPADLILSAYGLLVFQDMAEVFPVDTAVLRRTSDWLYSQQLNDGGWAHARGAGRDAASAHDLRTTAYVTWSLAGSGKDDSRLRRALELLSNATRSEVKDEYLLALVSNALTAAGRVGEAKPAVESLIGSAVSEGGSEHWSPGGAGVMYGRGDSMAVETTAFAALAMFASQDHRAKAEGAVRWLIRRRDAYGGWASTHATISALRAILASMPASGDASKTVSVNVLVDGEGVGKLAISPSTRDVVQVVGLRGQLREGKSTITLRPSADADLVYQVVVTHYVPWRAAPVAAPDAAMKLDVTLEGGAVRAGQTVWCRVGLAWHRDEEVRMPVIEVGLPPGFEVLTEDLEELKKTAAIQRYEVEPERVVFYLDRLSKDNASRLRYRLRALRQGKVKTPPSRAYPYYEPEAGSLVIPVPLSVM